MSFTNMTVLCHGRTISDEYLFPYGEFEERTAKVSGILDGQGLDGLVIYTESLSRGNVSYLTNYHNFLAWSVSLVVLPKGGRPTVLATIAPRDLAFVRKILPSFVEIIPVGLSLVSNEHISLKAIEYLKECKIFDKKWGSVNFDRMPHVAYSPWEEAYPGGLVDVTEAYEGFRAIKSPAEADVIAQASAMSKRAVCEYLRQAQAGVNESVLASKVDRQFRLEGADAVSLLTYSGRDGATMLRVPWERDFEEGDVVSAFANVQLLRYNGAYGASKVIGGGTSGQKALFSAADEIFNEKISEIETTARADIGYREFEGRPGVRCYTVINGVGIDLVEYPRQAGSTAELKGGNAVTVSLGAKKTGAGSVFKSRNYLFTDSGRLVSLSGPDK
jgi:Xaa-Pro aminopeptidase